MELYEKTIRSERVYEGKRINVRRDEVELPDGKRAVREICEHPDCVVIMARDENGDCVLVRQYRHAIGRVTLEFPAGKLDRGEEGHRDGALRELREETGLVPSDFVYLGVYLPSPGFSNEKLYVYLAKGLRAGAQEPDEDEFLHVLRMPEKEIRRKIARGEIQDGKTIAALMMAGLYEQGGEDG